ncbi:4-chlorobenzoate--CoA ligase [compost metagenome]
MKACVVLHPGQELSREEFDAYCREHMAAFKVPKHLSIRSALPKNATGKMLKRVLREEEGGVTKAAT